MSTPHTFQSKLVSNSVMLLFIALVGVTAYLTVEFQQAPRNEQELIEQTRLFSAKELESVMRITLKNKSGDYVFERSLTEQDRDWHMISPKSLPGSSLFIDQLYNSLKVIKTKNLLPDNNINASNFSLNKPTAVVTLENEQGKSIVVNVGIMNTIDNSTYLRVSGKTGIFHVEAPTLSLENATLNDLIESRIFALELNQINEIRLTKKQSPVPLLQATKKENGWVSATGAALDAAKLEDLVQSFNALKSSFILDKQSDAQSKQTTKLMSIPEYTVRVQFSDGNSSTYTVSQSATQLVDVDVKGDAYFLVSSTLGNIVYVVKEDSLSAFDLKADSLNSVQTPIPAN